MKVVKSQHIVMIPFTGVGLYGGYKGDEWFKERIEIFKKYTLRSLQNQKFNKFLLWMTFRKEEFFNPITRELGDFLRKEGGISYVMTFEGLMYHDDKFSGGYNRLLNFARIIRDCYRKKNIKGMLRNIKSVILSTNSTLRNRLGISLRTLRGIIEKDVEVIFLTRIDSDDMFHKEAIGNINKMGAFRGAQVMGNGYVYNDLTKQLAEWNPKTNPPFHTIVFPADTFFDARKHLKYTKGFKSHEDIPKIFKTKSLGDGLYCVLVHNPNNHISTIWNHPFRGRIIKDKKMLSNFGLGSSVGRDRDSKSL